MIEATIEDQAAALKWAEEKIGFPFRPDAKAIAFVRCNRKYAAVIVFDGFSECDCNIHVASDGTRKWLTREMVQTVFFYPFCQLGMRRVTGLVPTKNKAALNFDLRLGFEIEGKCRHALPDDDIYVLGMLRENCPFIPQEIRPCTKSH